MQQGLVRFAIILMLFQSIQGTIRHFNSNRSWRSRSENDADFILHFEKQSDDNTGADRFAKLLRERRQDLGGSPVAYPPSLVGDYHPFGLVIYSEEGSEASCLVSLYCIVGFFRCTQGVKFREFNRYVKN